MSEDVTRLHVHVHTEWFNIYIHLTFVICQSVSYICTSMYIGAASDVHIISCDWRLYMCTYTCTSNVVHFIHGCVDFMRGNHADGRTVFGAPVSRNSRDRYPPRVEKWTAYYLWSERETGCIHLWCLFGTWKTLPVKRLLLWRYFPRSS
jgi:hypothetical protein